MFDFVIGAILLFAGCVIAFIPTFFMIDVEIHNFNTKYDKTDITFIGDSIKTFYNYTIQDIILMIATFVVGAIAMCVGFFCFIV